MGYGRKKPGTLHSNFDQKYLTLDFGLPIQAPLNQAKIAKVEHFLIEGILNRFLHADCKVSVKEVVR